MRGFTWPQAGLASSFLLVGLLLCSTRARCGDDPSPGATTLQHPVKQRWQVGVIIEAKSGAVTGIEASLPIPKEWPEQQVREVSRDVSASVRSIRFRTLETNVKQMIVSIPHLAAGEKAKALLTLEITKHMLAGPHETSDLHAPRRPERVLRKYLLPSPYIESRDERIRKLAEQAVAGRSQDWQRVEAIFDWVRANVRYEFDTQIKGARKALEDGHGDCEELTSLFIAMCRARKIPARAVWIPAHCYPEFYLEDGQGQGHWYPCQAAGDRQFGAMTEVKPILQKGDNFRVPGQRQPQRYVAESLRARDAKAPPKVQFIRRQVN